MRGRGTISVSVGVVAVVVASGASVVSLRDAGACSCALRPALVFPADGATEVPTDVAVLVATQLPLDELRLLDQDGMVVPTTSTTLRWQGGQDDIVVDLASVLALQPGLRYRIEFRTRFALTSQSSSFVTGPGPGAAQVQAPSLATFTASEHLESMCSGRWNGSCYESGPVLRLDFADPAPGAVFALLEVRGAGEVAPSWIVPLREARWIATDGGVGLDLLWRKQLGGFTCAGVPPPLRAEHEYCATLVVRDAIGRLSRSNELCVMVDRCQYGSACTLLCGAALVDAGLPDGAGSDPRESSDGCRIGLGTAPRGQPLAPAPLLVGAIIIVVSGLASRRRRRVRRPGASSGGGASRSRSSPS